MSHKQTDVIFQQERMGLLQRFMGEISNYAYLSESDELFLFIQGSGGLEIDKSMNAMAKQKPKEIIEKYRKYFKGVNEEASTGDIMQHIETLEIFHKFCVQKISEITKMKVAMKKMKEDRDVEIKGQSDSMSELFKFEEIAISYFSD